MRPILKWAGGKSRLMPHLSPLLPTADCLVEPFVGGASVFLNTDHRRYVLADINPDLINFYQAVVDSPESVIRAVLSLFRRANTSTDYYQYRTDFRQWRVTKSLERAAVFLYLNRHGYNGLCRYNLRGEFNVPYGCYKKPYFPEAEIRLFAEKARDTHTRFVCLPFEEALAFHVDEHCAVYADPPYYFPQEDKAGFTGYYITPFRDEAHQALADALIEVNQRRGAPVVLSGSDTPRTHAAYAGFTSHYTHACYSLAAKGVSRGKAVEVIATLSAPGASG
ncbi:MULTISPECIES: DNA adenine methylase [Symbiopectobacterium]|uniref:DNA adenine methylase n=1 Tax=Symbiopectobacterium TaxID=801 RepID=UPI001A2B98E9|nr:MULTISPECIES: Dam family site-specific DNA-(adenine-N6)-methyltransferase [Symbiopectobacterium]MBG6247330.1 Dam family site-specific DNA-(adenine-N6)-methyltransferase [Candidatus Symbiopectobacterium sp. PLON1]MBT9429501.1 Dam family site-specific DNA-(adenine-N6)-methyltransferase [Candidatus Symbiopectobacterium endolongispinus]